MDRNPRPWTPRSVLMQMRTPSFHSLIGQNRVLPAVQSYTAPTGWRKPVSYWLKQNSRNSPVRTGSDGRSTGQAGGSVQASPRNAVCVHGPSVQMAARLWF